jgi:CRP-like cAMP-binding protein
MSTVLLIESVAPSAVKGLSRRELRVLSQLGTPMEVEAGHVFMRQGEVGRDCALIVSGSVEVVIDGESVTRVEAGDIIGEIALLAARNGFGTRTASLRALDDGVVIVFNSREFRTLCDLCPEFGAAIARTAVQRLDEDLTAARTALHSGEVFT